MKPDLRHRLFLLVTAATVGIVPGALSAGTTSPKPNILLVLSDDHSAPHVGCYGNREIKTPNLDRFATAGIRLDRAYVGCPQCVPSRATFMTGRSPVGIQMTRFSAPLPAEVVTFPELLRAKGYFTGICGRTFHLDGTTTSASSVKAMHDKHGLRTFSNRVDFLRVSNQKAALGEMRQFLDQAPKGAPFFLWVNFKDPHRPLDERAIPQPHDPARLTLPAHYPDTRLVREDFARYYDEISRMDGVFGEVLTELEWRGLGTNTLVAFIGDNGASQLRGKGTLYEFGIHVPWLMRWPGVIKAGLASSNLISGEDLAPTLLEAAGIEAPKSMTGRSFLRLLRNEPFDPRKYVFAERGAHSSGLPKNSASFDLGRCVVGTRYKLIYNALWQLPYAPVDFSNEPFWKELGELNAAGKLSPELSRIYFSPVRPMFELYDLQQDPAEMKNLADKPELEAIEGELKDALQEWMILERDYLPLPGGRKPK
jgi:N-sulfoglucosamine sulfohydrolase